jgi:hypothetical protein
MRHAEINNAIFANVNGSWKKVALVIAKASTSLNLKLPDDEVEFDVIAKHIEVLINEGKLIAQGDVSDWRSSEVRRP